MTEHVIDHPEGLTRRARRFLQANGVRMPTWTIDQHRRHWTGLGRPTDAVDRLIAHQQRWGGLVLPPATGYDGGPFDLDADDPDLDDDGLVFTVGRPRYSVPYGYAVDGDGRFGICGSGYAWVALHARIEGWVEALALEYAARQAARLVRRVTGTEATDVIAGLAGQPPIDAVAGLADNWWQLPGSLISVTSGESQLFGAGLPPTVLVYEGVPDDLSAEP